MADHCDGFDENGDGVIRITILNDRQALVTTNCSECGGRIDVMPIDENGSIRVAPLPNPADVN